MRRDLDRLGHQPHAVPCVVIIGLQSEGEERAKVFEQYRQSTHGVRVITYDELVGRLQSLYNLLCPPEPALPLHGNEDVPF